VLAAAPVDTPTADNLFDQSVVNDIRLTMKPGDWDTLRATCLEDTYYPADMAWQGQVVPMVGVRSRGSGSRNPYKPGLKVDFGRYVDQKLLGLKSVVLANAVQDPAMLKQRVAMLMYERMGVPAPRVAHVRVFVNEVYVGLYMLIEPIDTNFLARVYWTDQHGKKENDGYLYEYVRKDAYEGLPGPGSADLRRAVRAEDPMYRFQGKEVSQLLPWDKGLAFWAVDRDILQGVTANVLASRTLAIPWLYRTYLETLLACAAAAMAPVSSDSPTGWLEAEAQKETAQIRAAGYADEQKPFTNERFEDELGKMLEFARERGPSVIREARKALAWTE
jgi:hypothetical protein